MTKTQIITRWILLTVVTLAFLTVGTLKLAGTAMEKELFVAWGYPIWFMYVVGAGEVLGAIGLHVKRMSRWAAIGLVVLLIGAISTHVWHNEGPIAPIPATLLMLFLFGILYLNSIREDFLNNIGLNANG